MIMRAALPAFLVATGRPRFTAGEPAAWDSMFDLFGDAGNTWPFFLACLLLVGWMAKRRR